MFCRKCGAELQEASIFCSNCGEKVGDLSNAPQLNNQPNNTSTQPSSSSYITSVDKNAWEYFTSAFKKYLVFSGRARRAEYWFYALFYFIFLMVASVLDIIIFDQSFSDLGVIYIITTLVFFLPSWSVMVRRYHDTDRSAWYCLIPIYSFILLFYDGTKGQNRFGDDPKGR